MLSSIRRMNVYRQALLVTACLLLTFSAAFADQHAAQPTQISPAALEELVGPVALYPDDLLAIVLPASAYPLQVVQAARYLEEHVENPDLRSSDEWDDAVVALLNYPEVIELMNDDLDWTWGLGEAFINQQADVISAVQEFRKRAYLSGNLRSDDLQVVRLVDGMIEIRPVEPAVLYVPDYEPEQIVVNQTTVVYRYYPYARPVYYYPYPSRYAFPGGYFWGVTTVYRFGWLAQALHLQHHRHRSHPYYGDRYRHRYTTRRRTHADRDLRFGSAGSHPGRSGYRGTLWKPGARHGARPQQRKTRDHRERLVAWNSRSPRAERHKTGRSRPQQRHRRSNSVISAESTRRVLGITSRTEIRRRNHTGASARDSRDRGRRVRTRNDAHKGGISRPHKRSRQAKNLKPRSGRKIVGKKQRRSHFKTGNKTRVKVVNGYSAGKSSKGRKRKAGVATKSSRQGVKRGAIKVASNNRKSMRSRFSRSRGGGNSRGRAGRRGRRQPR